MRRHAPLLATGLLIAAAGAGGNAWASTSPAHAGRSEADAERVIGGHKSITTGHQADRSPGCRTGTPSPRCRPLAQPRLAHPLFTTPTAKINVTYIGFPAAAAEPSRPRSTSGRPDPQHGADRRRGRLVEPHSAYDEPGRPRRRRPHRLRGELHQRTAAERLLPDGAGQCDHRHRPAARQRLQLPTTPNTSGAEISASFNSDQSQPGTSGTDGNPAPARSTSRASCSMSSATDSASSARYDGLATLTPGSSRPRPSGFGDGQNPTVFDTFVADGPGVTLDTDATRAAPPPSATSCAAATAASSGTVPAATLRPSGAARPAASRRTPSRRAAASPTSTRTPSQRRPQRADDAVAALGEVERIGGPDRARDVPGHGLADQRVAVGRRSVTTTWLPPMRLVGSRARSRTRRPADRPGRRRRRGARRRHLRRR